MDELRERFEKIRRHYREFGPITESNEWKGGPYTWDYYGSGISFTPIESALWSDIRAEDLVMYPQLPVGRYFVDFGNPVEKVAIECDGFQWHLDKARDAARQREIEALGWTVYRISGADCFSEVEEYEDAHGTPRLWPSRAREFVRNLSRRHPRIRRDSRTAEDRKRQDSFECLFGEYLA